MTRKLFGQLFRTVPLILLFSGAVFACSLVAGAENPTPATMAKAMGFLVASVFLLAGHTAIFFYRRLKSKWVFGLTAGISVLVIPFSSFMMMVSAGTACGEGSIEIALYNLFFQLGALFIHLISWRRGDQTQPILIDINEP